MELKTGDAVRFKDKRDGSVVVGLIIQLSYGKTLVSNEIPLTIDCLRDGGVHMCLYLYSDQLNNFEFEVVERTPDMVFSYQRKSMEIKQPKPLENSKTVERTNNLSKVLGKIMVNFELN